MRHRLVLLAALAIATPLAAQDAAPRFSLGGGIELLAIRDNTTWTPGISLQGSYWFPKTTDHLNFRLTGTFIHHTNPLVDTRMYAYTASAELVVNARRSGQGLYGVAGMGIARLGYSRDAALTSSYYDPGARATSPVMVAGVGFSQRIGRMTWFAESRLTHFTAGERVAWAQLPLTIGLRF
jgi:hypothetical protein